MTETCDTVRLLREETMKSTVAIKGLRSAENENYFTVVPPWLIVMYNTIFFEHCMVHPNRKKNELDRFCIDCLSSLCSHCLPSHTRHKHVKIRRYVYKDVINRHDLNKLFSCSGIQTYYTNKTKVLFLKPRNHHHSHQQQLQQIINSKDYSCIICDRNLPDNSLYCSIACKAVALFGDRLREEIKDESNNKHSYNHKLKLIISDEDEDKEYMTPPPSFKKQNQKRSRKGIPLRAPIQ